jgi:hypothetical protein
MPRRLRLLDFRKSRGPQAVGLCQSDLAGAASIVNAAQTRLVLAREAGDAGWWGSWARMVFQVSQGQPTITTPREVARLERIDICNRPIKIQNEFYEFLDYGVGLQPRAVCNFLETYERGVFPTFIDLTPGSIVRAYLTDVDDTDTRVLIQGTDANGNTIYTADGLTTVTGVFLSLISPFVDSPLTLNSITGIQKDVTVGPVQFYEVNPTTGAQTLILTMEPSETVAAYRRYFVNGLPTQCCCGPTAPQVTAIAKLDLIPVAYDPDYLLIQNLEALILECQALADSEKESADALQRAAVRHQQAIRLLQGELVHFMGKERPAITFKPFGSASLERRAIGTLT